MVPAAFVTMMASDGVLGMSRLDLIPQVKIDIGATMMMILDIIILLA